MNTHQFIIRQIPEVLNGRLRAVAKRKGKSLNKTIVGLLSESVGLTDNTKKKRDLSRFAGTWNQKEASEFSKHTKIFEQIDKEIWKK